MAENSVTIPLKVDNSNVKSELSRSEDLFTQWSGKLKGLLVGVGAAFALKGLWDFTAGIVNAYQAQIDAEAKIASVLKATGEAAGFDFDQMVLMADQMEALTGIAGDVVLSTQAVIATFKNVRGEQFKQVTMLAADMAAVLGTDLSGEAKKLASALNDPTKGMEKLRESGVSLTESQKELITELQKTGDYAGAQQILLDELAKTYGGAATEKAHSFWGQLGIINEKLGGVGDSIAQAVLPTLESLIPVIDDVVTVFGNLASMLGDNSEYSRGWAESFGDSVKWAFETAVNMAADLASGIEYYFNTFTARGQRDTDEFLLSLVSTWEDLKHLFTKVGPEYLNYFGENWHDIFMDIGQLEVVVLNNAWKNAVNFFDNLVKYLSGDAADFEFTALTEGFTRTAKKLPEIAERMKTDTEKNLQSNIDNINKNLAEEWDKTFQKNRDFAKSLFDRPPTIDVKPNQETIDKAIADQKAEADKAAQKASEKVKKDAKETKEAVEETSKLGEHSGITDLAKSIQDSLFANASKSVQVPAGAKTQDDFARALGLLPAEKPKETATPAASGGGGATPTTDWNKKIFDQLVILTDKMNLGLV